MINMRERKVVKFRVDMYDDTKFKIIDMKPERDLIHYIWTRLVTLAGKVNLEGDLYMSKNLPYTIETLAIEFNRGTEQIKLALDVFIELEMIELTEENVYRVKNFAKHQNIKVKEKINSKDKEDVESKDVMIKEAFKIEVHDNKNERSENKNDQSGVKDVKNDDIGNLEIVNNDINKVDNNISKKKINNDPQNNMSINNSEDNIPIILEMKKKKANKKKKKGKSFDINEEEEIEDNPLICFYNADEERLLGEGESVVSAWAF